MPSPGTILKLTNFNSHVSFCASCGLSFLLLGTSEGAVALGLSPRGHQGARLSVGTAGPNPPGERRAVAGALARGDG